MTDDAQLVQIVQRFARAREIAARAIAENPNDARALFAAAMAYVLSGDYPSALTALNRACALDQGNTHFLYERGKIEEYLGKFDDAINSYRRALSVTPENYKARQALVQMQKQTLASNSIGELEDLFRGPDADGWRTLHIGHALAKTFEDIGETATAFAWLTHAKARRGVLRSYSREREEDLALAVIASSRGDAAPASGDDAAEPIFVAGLPRSGTTLVDRILSSHPDVMSAGEIGNFTYLFKRMTRSTSPASLDPDTFGRAEEVDFVRLGRFYIESTRPLTGATPRFVDKAPSNYLQAGMILRALPNARIVCLRRSPLDSVLSNYRQIFPIDDRYYDYVYDLESAAHKVVQFDRVMRHWAAVLPPERFLELSYEDLVSNQGERTRALLRFCGLSWDDRCMAFHENAAAVGTPSAVQVRSAMYASSVGKWTAYGALLDPARRVFERAGIAIS
jgi:tetratricopeptide (TPR) repeat protein